ncbi:hypothetical protein L208DRAFT_1447872 [Tricholoma matsutake]|nr:hypothetical protein L208DRAFT_1447872 [Tricholoma matsutake 945]
MSFATAQSPPAAVCHATTFLTQPLLAIHPELKIASVRLVLHSTLTSAFFSSSSNMLNLSLSPNTTPPRAIHAACIAASIPWSDWIFMLGGSTFELHIMPTRVSVCMFDGRTAHVWEDSCSAPASQANPLAALQSSLKRRTRPPTLAQQLLESTHEDKEAEEMFAMLSKCDISIVSPTPTRGTFSPMSSKVAFDIPLPPLAKQMPSVHLISFPDSLSEADLDSRPSSRSSNTSLVSLSSFTSSSASTISSASSIRSSPSPSPGRKRREEKQVVVDTMKTTPTRYTYSGGVSTVLTGGVMLGSKPKASSRHSTLRKIHSSGAAETGATQGKGKAALLPVWKPRAKSASLEASNWRRGGACSV